ncbi:NAD-dependent epimerase/dehydratase family protein [Falsihalocynthiibacter sp. BN13B15]|uniref:NAD-dependent epimerase/dehydratase family protein n=1 Tax=Falsihalocynthiibacter sp. BN13B15 TaxID=3240871 RepID=UPI00351054DD
MTRIIREHSLPQPQRIVVLGGSGFLGRSLTQSLAQAGHSVIAASRRPLLPTVENLTCVKVDFADTTALEEIVCSADTVIQLVNGINPSTGNTQLIQDIEQEVQPQIRLLELCVASKVKRVIFASSGGAIYGNASESPTSERAIAMPRNSYGIVKLMIEKYMELFRIEHGMDFVTLRLSNPYGPGQNFRASQGFLVPSLLGKIQNGEAITVFGDGNDSRDYVYIDDVVRAFLSAVNLEGSVGHLINIGGGAHHTVNELIEVIEDLLGRPVARNHVSRRGSDIPRSFLDIAQAKTCLAWQPRVSLREGLKQTIESMSLV